MRHLKSQSEVRKKLMFKGLKEGNWLDLRNQEDWNIGEMVRQAGLRFFMGSWATLEFCSSPKNNRKTLKAYKQRYDITRFIL